MSKRVLVGVNISDDWLCRAMRYPLDKLMRWFMAITTFQHMRGRVMPAVGGQHGQSRKTCPHPQDLP